CIVIGASDRSDRRLDACLGEPLAEPDRCVLRSPIRMVDNVFQVEYAFLLAGPDGLLDRVEDHGGGHRGSDPPAQDPASVGVGDKGHVGEPCPGRHIGEVCYPQPVRCWWSEAALDEIGGTGCGRISDRGPAGFAAGGPGQAEFGHQPFDGASGHLDALTVQG
nr:hypothetical protein c - Mycobacterium bovis insertion sequence IS987 [Mycobacterium tuberculosis variant bovis]